MRFSWIYICFLRFAVTLLARPKKLDVGDHSCIAPFSFGGQSIIGRKEFFRRIIW